MAEKDPTARLRRAVKENNLFLVKRLIQRTDMRNPDPAPKRYTSLAWAAVLGHEETFEFLLTAGHDDVELSKDSENNTILILLAEHKPPPINPYTSRPDSPDTMGAALRMARLYYDRYSWMLDWANIQGKTALHVAALKGNEELVRMLCDLGADYDLSDNKGNTPLHYASSWGHVPIVQLLIERGCQYTARNNRGFTASDYAYSISTRDTLQDSARLQFENNKKGRWNVFAQAAARGNEREGSSSANTPPPVPPKTRDVRQASSRMRSSSGTTRAPADNGEPDANGLVAPTNQSVSTSPSQLSAGFSSFFLTHQHPSQASSTSGVGTVHNPGLNPPSANPASALSPIATRMRERDADAMEKYMKRNRSESQGTSSTDTRSQNGSVYASAGPSANGDDISSLAHVPNSGSTTPRTLRPSVSAAQLRTTTESPNGVPVTNADHPQPESRNRSGTNPTTQRPTVILTRSSSTSNSSRSIYTDQSVFDEPQTYTGPSSQYSQFPEPPLSDQESTTPTTGRRLPFHLLSKPAPDSPAVGHRRGPSVASVRGG